MSRSLSDSCLKQALCLCPLSVLGTLAATYLTIAIIIKYHTTPTVLIHITPLYSSGYVRTCVCVCGMGQMMGSRVSDNLFAPLVTIATELKIVLARRRV